MTTYETKLKERAEELREFMLFEVFNDKSKGYETLAAYVLQKESEAYKLGSPYRGLNESDELNKELIAHGLIPPSHE